MSVEILSRLQFALTITFHIVCSSLSIGIAMVLIWLEIRYRTHAKPGTLRLFRLWLSLFGITFVLGTVTGIAVGVQFGTNWPGLVEKLGAVQGPLMGYESFTAFSIEAIFFGILLFGRDRVSSNVYLFSVFMVCLGTLFSTFWIMANNTWMQMPTGYTIVGDKVIPTDWSEIILNGVAWLRWAHMILGAFIVGASLLMALGTYYRNEKAMAQESKWMQKMGISLLVIMLPLQMFFGHKTGHYIHSKQAPKFAGIEARWETQQPAPLVLFAWPQPDKERNLFEVKVPYLGSWVGSGNFTSQELGLKAFPEDVRPPVRIPFFAFRAMVGAGLVVFFTAVWGGVVRLRGKRLPPLWVFVALCTPGLSLLAIVCGWYVAEVGRFPWVAYNLLRIQDVVTTSVPSSSVALSFIILLAALLFITGFGLYYGLRKVRTAPQSWS